MRVRRATDARPPPQRSPVFSPEIAYLVFDVLSDPDARRPMFGSGAPMELDFPVALKTGTTRAYTDDLAFGITRDYTVGVWAGNFDGSPTAGVMAMQGAAPLVRAAFVSLAARFGAPTAPTSGHARAGEVCALSGMRRRPRARTSTETLRRRTRAASPCSWHRRACGRREVKYPPELEGWARVHGLVHGGPLTAPGDGHAGDHLSGRRRALRARPGARGGRPAAPLRAIPARAPIHWTVDGIAAECFVPSPGAHLIKAASAASNERSRSRSSRRH